MRGRVVSNPWSPPNAVPTASSSPPTMALVLTPPPPRSRRGGGACAETGVEGNVPTTTRDVGRGRRRGGRYSRPGESRGGDGGDWWETRRDGAMAMARGGNDMYDLDDGDYDYYYDARERVSRPSHPCPIEVRSRHCPPFPASGVTVTYRDATRILLVGLTLFVCSTSVFSRATRSSYLPDSLKFHHPGRPFGPASPPRPVP